MTSNIFRKRSEKKFNRKISIACKKPDVSSK